MIDRFYELLDKIGYTHPIHPALTHIPIGLTIGVFIFALVALLFRRNVLPSVAYRRIILLALIFVFPTALFGYMDWQYFYRGDWSFPIKIKLAMTGVLIVLLAIAYIYGRKAEAETKGLLTIYALCLLTVTVLGYFGGELIFSTKGMQENVPVRFALGEKIFTENCGDCHPHGGDIVDSPLLQDYKTFLAFIRKPSGDMPPIPTGQISDAKARRLYLYLVQLSGEQAK